MNLKVQGRVREIIKRFGSSVVLPPLVPNGGDITIKMVHSERAADFPFKSRPTMESLPDRTNRASLLVGVPATSSLPNPPSGEDNYADGVDYIKRLFSFAQTFSFMGVRYTVYRIIPLSASDIVLYIELVCDHQ